jgi:hypothetical protein
MSETRSRENAPGKLDGGCRVLLTLDGRFKQVSQEFSGLIDYEQKELIGERIDDVTASGAVHIPQHLGVVVHFGQFHSLWMFVGREGQAIVARCDWELLGDASIAIVCQPIRPAIETARRRVCPSENPP